MDAAEQQADLMALIPRERGTFGIPSVAAAPRKLRALTTSTNGAISFSRPRPLRRQWTHHLQRCQFIRIGEGRVVAPTFPESQA